MNHVLNTLSRNSRSELKALTMLSLVFLTASISSLSAMAVFPNELSKHRVCSRMISEAALPGLALADITVNTVASSDPTDCTVPNGSITINAEGNNPNLGLRYSIDNGGVFQESNQFNNLAAGTYSVVVQYEDGTCPLMHGDVTLNPANVPVIDNISMTNVTDCGANNGSFFIEASGAGALEFSIDGGANYVFSGFFSNLSAGNYTIIVRNAGTDCTSAAMMRTITEPLPPNLTGATPTNLSGCASSDGTISISATGGTNGNFEYSVDGGMSWQAASLFTALGAGDYTPAVRNADDDTCPQVGLPITLTAPDAPEIGTPTVAAPSTCTATDGSITINVSNADPANLEFSIDNGLTWQAGAVFTGLGGGTYTIRVRTNDQTCFVSGPQVTLPGGIEPNIVDYFVQQITDCGANNGIITVIVDNDPGTFEYSIDNGVTFQVGNSFQNLSEGSYDVVVRRGDQSCPVNGNNFQINEPTPITIQDVTVNPETNCESNDASIVITATGGTGNFAYSINNGISFQTSGTFTFVAPGDYQIVVENINETCPVAFGSTTTVTGANPPQLDIINAVPATNCDATDGSITVTASGGTGSYEYSLDNGATWQTENTFNGLGAGEYLIGIRNADGTCPLLGNAAELLATGIPAIDNIDTTNPTDCNVNDGIITVTAADAGIYQYSIDGLNFQDSNTFNNLPAGMYTITVRNDDGSCPITSEPVALMTDAGVIQNVEFINPSACEENNGSITVTAMGANVEYSIDGTNYQPAGFFDNLAAGVYPIFIRNADDVECVVEGETVTLIAPNQPATPTFFTENPSGCNIADGAITVLVSNDAGAFQYSIDGGGSFQNSNSFSGLAGGEYQIVVSSGDCSVSGGSVSLLEPTTPSITNVESQDPVNCNINDGFIIITGEGAGDLEYSIDGGLTWQFFGTFNGLSAGEYFPAIRNLAGGTCPVTGTPVTLSSPDQAEITSITENAPTTCTDANGSLVIAATGGSGDLEYSIDNGENFQASNTFENLGVGTFNVIVRNADGSCASDAVFAQLSSSDAPTVEAPLVNQPSDCDANDGIIVITAEGGSGSLEYSINGGTSWTTDNSFTGLTSGAYDVLVRNDDGSCPISAGTVNLTSEDSPAISSVFVQNVSDCNGVTDGLITVITTNDDGTFEYSIDGGTTYQASNEFSGLTAGEYAVAVRKGGTDCVVSGGTQVVGTPVIPTLIIVNVNNAQCGGTDGAITLEATGGAPAYEYTIDGGTTWVVGGSFENLAPGSYNPGVRDSDTDCAAFGDAITIAENEGITFNSTTETNPTQAGASDGSISISATACNDAQLEYSIDGGLTWQTSNTFDGLPAGTYPVVVRIVGSTTVVSGGDVVLVDPTGTPCAEISDVQVSQPSAEGASDGSISISISGGTGTYTYSIDGGNTFTASSTFNNLSEGSYTIVITDGADCTVTGQTVNLTGGGNGGGGGTFTVGVTSANPSDCDLTDGSITITEPIGAEFEYSINGTDFNASNSFPSLPAGSYTVVVRNTNTNETEAFAGNPVILESPNTVSFTAQASPAGCDSDDGSIEITAANGNGSGFEYSFDGGATWGVNAIASNLPSGMYSVSARNADGSCAAGFETVMVMQTGNITIESIDSSDIGCGNEFGGIVITASGGTGTFEYSIDGGASWQASNIFGNLAGGIYDVAVRNADGTCATGGGQVSIESNTDLSISAVNVTNIGCSETTGSITIEASGAANLEYSIDGGANFSPFNTFNDLPVGTYTIVVQNQDGSCTGNGGEVMLTNEGGDAPVIEGVIVDNPSGCGTPDGTITVDVNNVAALEFSIDGGLNYQESNIFQDLAAGAYSVFVRNNDGSCPTEYAINPVVLENEGTDLFTTDVITVQFEEAPQKACVPAPIGELVAYDLIINGAPYTEPLQGCNDQVFRVYSYAELGANGDSGPYMVNEWICNGGTFSGMVADLDALVAQMNAWDPNGNWEIRSGQTIWGGEEGATYSDIDITRITTQTNLFLMVNETSLPMGTCIFTGGPGEYELIAQNDAGCTDTITIIVEGEDDMNPGGGEGDTIFLSTPINLPTDEICFTGENLPTGEIASLGFCGAAENGGAPITNFEENCITYFPNMGFLGQDEFCVVVCEAGGVICDTTIVVVTVHPVTDEVPIEVVTDGTEEYCLDAPILGVPGTVVSAEACGIIEEEMSVSFADSCVTFTPQNGFVGMTEVCVVHCDDSTPNAVCDTTIFNVNVLPACEPVFAMAETTILSVEPTAEFCLPVSQLELLSDYTITLDGMPYNDAPTPCDVDTIYNYPYGQLPNDGLDGPLEVVEWICNGQNFSFIAPDVNALLDSMQTFDPAGNWTINTETQFISGGEQGGGYSDMTIDLPGGTDQVILDVSLTFEAQGGAIEIEGYGLHEVILSDGEGCSDTINVTLEEDIEGQFIDITTPFETMITLCADTMDLPGNFSPDLGYCDVPMSGTAPLIPGTSCVEYTPIPGFVGLDTLCLIACDDSPVAVCENTTYIIQVLPPTDTINITATTITEFESCLPASEVLQLPGSISSASICGFNEDEVAVSVQDTCLTIDLADNFAGTTEICVVHCDDSDPVFCDTTYVFVTGGVECEDIIASTDTTLIVTDGNSNICLTEVLPIEIGNIYEVDLDGSPYDGPIGGCEFMDAFTYNIGNLSEGPFPNVGWTVNGEMFTGSANSLQGLVDSLNTWNPGGGWVLNEMMNNISGLTATDTYGDLTIQDANEIITLAGGISQIPGGTVFVFQEPGGHTLVFTDIATGCTDTININFLDEQFVINIETFQNVNDTTCFNISEDYPNFDSLSICGQPTNGTFEIFNDTCFIFTPDENYLGADEACIQVCSTIDDAVVCDEYTVLINVIPDCEGQEDLIEETNVTLMTEDCDATVIYCLPTNDADLTGYIITDNGTEITPPNCGGVTGGFYDYTEIVTLDAGNYFVDSIYINGVLFSGGFETDTTLVDSLNAWSMTESWILDSEASQFVTTDLMNTYDTLFISNDEGTQWALPFNTSGTPEGLELTLTSGIHQIVFTDEITTCADTVSINVQCPDTDGCPELSAISPEEIITMDCETPVEFCISIPVDSLVNYTITDNGAPYTGGAVECTDNAGSAALQLLPGEHTILFVRNDGSCEESFFVDVRCIVFEDMDIDTTINLGQPEIICLYDDLDIDTTGIISITNTCADNTEENVDFIIDLETLCITLEPLNIGLDTACLEICNAMECINVNINVTVLEQCDDLFAVDNVGLGLTDCTATEGDICLPILLEDLAETDIFVNGVIYEGPRGVCDVDSIYSIGLATVPAAGQIGPYEVTFTITNLDGEETVAVDTFDTIDEALVLLNDNDPANPWVFQDFPAAFIGGSSLNNYTLGVVQLDTQESVLLGVDVFLDPNGTSITVPFGTTEIVFEDQMTGCRDTLVSTVACVETEEFIVTIPVGITDTLCFDTLDLPGNFVSIFNDCPGLSGTEAEVTIIGATPELGDSLCISIEGLEVGTESACIVLCDDLGVCDTNFVTINVIPGDGDLPIALPDSTVTGQGQPVVFNPFINDEINGQLDTFYILTQPLNGQAGFSPDGTINYVPNEGYCDPATPDSLQYVICNTIGCDTAWAFITVNCPGITIFDGFTPNGDGVNETFFIQGIEAFENSELIIYNRWGNRVHEATGYLNDWSGTWDGKDLPDGTYFYILRLNDDSVDENEFAGWLQINR